MFGEKPVRQSVTPISSAIERNRFLKTSNSIGLILIAGASQCLTCHDVRVAVNTKAPARGDDDSRFGASDDRRARAASTWPQSLPAVERRQHAAALESRGSTGNRLRCRGTG